MFGDAKEIPTINYNEVEQLWNYEAWLSEIRACVNLCLDGQACCQLTQMLQGDSNNGWGYYSSDRIIANQTQS